MALYSDAAGKQFQKVYKRIGIRRDRNFSDLSNPTKGLENLLDTLVDVTGTQFLSTDLAAIKNIFARGLTNSGYLNIAGSAVQFTTPNGVTASYNPRITYQNRLDKIRLFSGEPRLNGGNGLTAKYFQNDQIIFDEHSDFQYNVDPNTTAANVFSGITTEGAIEDDNFWEKGNFSYDGNVHPQSAKVNTGVKWEGYFVPTTTGTVEFEVKSTGYFTLDFQQVGYEEDNDKNIISTGIGTYKEAARVGLSTSISNISSVGTDAIIVSGASQLEQMNTIGIGMTVVHTNITPNTKVQSFDRTTGAISLVSPTGNAIISSFSGQTIEFKRDLGTLIESIFTTQVLTAYEKYRIRFRYFHHRNFESKDIIRSIDMNYRQKNQSTTTHLRYTSLYSLDYDFSNAAKGEFNTYLDNSVLFGGTNVFPVQTTDPIGLGSRSDSAKYSKLKSTSKLDITYKVKQELGSDTGSKTTGIIRRSTSCTIETGSAIIPIDFTTNIEIGSYVFGTGIPENSRVIDISINQFVVIDRNATASGSEPITFINHRGFVKRVIVNANVSGSNEIIANSSTPLLASTPSEETTHTDVQKDMVVIGSGINAVQITGVTGPSGGVDGGKLTLASNVSASANESIYIYQSRGLKDNSLITFCDKLSETPDVQCLIATSAVASGNEIPIETTTDGGTPPVISAGAINTNNIGTGNWNIQGFNFASGTKIESISTNKITLTENIEKAIVSGTQFTATTFGDDRQLCCPPTDTSPPFTATEEGLNTDIIDRPNLRFENGNLIFDQLIIQVNSTSGNAEDSDSYTSAQIDRKVTIKTNVNPATGTGKNYKILASST